MSTLMRVMTGRQSRWRKSSIWASNEENSLFAAEFDDCRTTQAKPAWKNQYAGNAEKIRLKRGRLLHHFLHHLPINLRRFVKKSVCLGQHAKIAKNAGKPVKSRVWRFMKGYKRYDKNTIHLPRQDSGMKVLEGNNSDKLRQIGAMGLVRYYSFTTI